MTFNNEEENRKKIKTLLDNHRKLSIEEIKDLNFYLGKQEQLLSDKKFVQEKIDNFIWNGREFISKDGKTMCSSGIFISLLKQELGLVEVKE